MIITIANQKGGVGKSSTAHAFAGALKRLKKSVLLVDFDPQGNLSYTLGASSAEKNAYKMLTKEASASESIVKTAQGDIIPVSNMLANADIVLSSTGKEFKLKEALDTIKNDYDFIIIDTPPALGILTINAFTASDGLVVPSGADIYSLQGIGQLKQTVDAVKNYCNPGLEILGILLTRHNTRTIISQDLAEIIEQTAKEFNTIVYDTSIREAVAIKEAQAQRVDLFDYAKYSNVAVDYMSFAKEFLKRIGDKYE